MNLSVVILLIVSGWGLLSIVVSLGLGEIVKSRDRGANPSSRLRPSDLEDLRTDGAKRHSATRRSA
jgi:hypothetical protein